MKVFVAGATGVLGRASLRALAAAGHDVTAAARSTTKAKLVAGLGARPAILDLFDADEVSKAAVGHDVVCNFATHIPRFNYYLRSAWNTNDRLHRDLSSVLVDAARGVGAERYLQHSVAFMYAEGGDRWLDEDAPVDPRPHGHAVLAAEESARRFTNHGGAGIALRFGLFYGPSATSARDLLRFGRSGFVPFPGATDALMTFVHVDDLGTSVVAALGAPAGVYNVTDDEPLTRSELGAEFARALGAASRSVRLRVSSDGCSASATTTSPAHSACPTRASRKRRRGRLRCRRRAAGGQRCSTRESRRSVPLVLEDHESPRSARGSLVGNERDRSDPANARPRPRVDRPADWTPAPHRRRLGEAALPLGHLGGGHREVRDDDEVELAVFESAGAQGAPPSSGGLRSYPPLTVPTLSSRNGTSLSTRGS